VGSLIRLDRLDEARALMKSAEEQRRLLSHPVYRYALAFLEHDNLEMAHSVKISGSLSNLQFSYIQAQTARIMGRLRESRELMRRGDQLARQSDQEQLCGLF